MTLTLTPTPTPTLTTDPDPNQVQNVTCLQPAVEGTGNNVIDDALASTPLTSTRGRACDGGCCTDACSRVVFPTFATDEEVEAFRTELEHAMTEPFHQFSLSKCGAPSVPRLSLHLLPWLY